MRSKPAKLPSVDELRGAEYLSSLGYQDPEITYEPLGRDTAPDFSIGSEIAVEVMRLTKYSMTDGSPIALESAAIPIERRMRQYLHTYVPSFSTAPDQPSWFVGFSFRRPLPRWEMVLPSLTAALLQFGRDGCSPRRYRLSPNLSITVTPSSRRAESFFRLGGWCDQDATGWVVSQLSESAAISLERKAAILDSILGFSERWLLLIDYVTAGNWDSFEIDPNGWDRVILASPGEVIQSYEPPRKLSRGEATITAPITAQVDRLPAMSRSPCPDLS